MTEDVTENGINIWINEGHEVCRGFQPNPITTATPLESWFTAGSLLALKYNTSSKSTSLAQQRYIMSLTINRESKPQNVNDILVFKNKIYAILNWLTLQHSTFTPVSLNQSDMWYPLQTKNQTKPKNTKKEAEASVELKMHTEISFKSFYTY